MLVNTLFIYSIVCWSPKITTIIILASGVLLTSFSLFASSSFLISGLRNSEAYNAFSLLFHEQCRLLVTKDGHNHYISIETLVAVVFLTVCFSKFLISGLRIFEEYNRCYHFIHQQCFLLVTKDGHNHYLGLGSFVDQFRCLLLAFSWILVGAALKQKLIFTLLLINSVVCGSPKAVTMIIFQSKIFHWHLCQSLLLANSWFLVYESLSGKCFSPLYSSSVLSVGHQRWSQWLSFSRKFFTDIFVRVCFSNFLISGLRIFEEYSACYHFIHRQCCLLVNKMITLIILASEVSLTSFSLFASSIFLISELRSSAA